MSANELWAIWLVVAVVAALIELMTPSFGFIFVGIAALLSVIASLVGLPWFVQVAVFVVVLPLLLILVRPWLQKKLSASRGVPSRAERFVGVRALVTEPVDPVRGIGRVLVAGEDWAATSKTPIPEGTEVVVESVDGIRLLVAFV